MRYRLSLKLLFWFSLLVIGIVAVNLLSIYQIDKVGELIKKDLPTDIKRVEKTGRLDFLAQLIRYYDEVLTQSARNYAFTGNQRWKERYKNIEPKLDKVIKEAISKGDEKDKAFFTAVEAANEILVDLEHQAIEFVDQGNRKKAISILESNQYSKNKKLYFMGFNNYLSRRERQYDKALVFISEDLDNTTKTLNRIISQSYYFFIFSLFFILILSVLFGLFLRFSISKPLSKLVNLIKNFGKKGESIDIDSTLKGRNDEIGQLATTFNQMSKDLEKTTVSRERLAKEVELHKEAKQKISRLNTILRSISEINQMLINVDNRKKLIEKSCAELINVRGYQNAWIVLLNKQGKYLDAASAGLGEQFNLFKNNIKAGNIPRCLNRICNEQKLFQIDKPHQTCKDCPLYEYHQGVKTVVTCLQLEGNIYGALTVVIPNSIEVDNQELSLLKEISGDISLGLHHLEVEEKRKSVEEKFRTLVDNVPGVIYRCAKDSNWTMNYISDEIKNLSGYPASDFIKNKVRSYVSIIHEEDRALVDQKIQEAITKKRPYELEYRIVDKYNEIKWVSERGQGVFNENGETIWLDGVIFNITLQKKAKEKLKKAIKTKSDFLSTVSHELRTPLAAIKEGINIVYDQSAGKINKEQKDFLKISKRNVDRLARLINDVLDIQKLESGKMEFNFRENDLNSIIEEIFATMKPQVVKKGLQFKLDLDKSIPKIEVDRDKLIQVITNLVSNAIKFTEKGAITISSLVEKNTVKVEVKDTGPGIKKEDLPKLFKTFQQLQAGKGRKTGGTGLGLAICKDIINKHRGKIWVESKLGEGSKFGFLLPIKETRT